MFAGRNADPDVVNAERPDNLLLHEGVEGSAFWIGAPHDLRDHPAESQALVTVARARLEYGRQARDLIDHPVIIGHRFWCDGLRHLPDAGAVVQNVTNRQLILAVGREFRPIARNRRIVLDEPARHLDMQGSRSDRLYDGEGGKQRIGLHFLPRGGVGDACPDIDYQFGICVDGELDADFATFLNGTLHRIPERRDEICPSLANANVHPGFPR
jgi:hypothetical protein